MNHTAHPKLAAKTRIVVAGVGGTGTQVLTGLARLDAALRSMGHQGLFVIAADPDTVNHANLGRQLFYESDIGMNKAEALIHRINSAFGQSWAALPYAYNSSIHGKCQVVIGCVDSRKARAGIRSSFNGFSQPAYYLDCGNSDRTGQVLLGCRHKGKFWLPMPWLLFPDLFDRRRNDDDTPSCSLAEALDRQDLFINQKVATMACDLLWQLFRYGGTDYSGYIIGEHKINPLPATPETWKRLNPAINVGDN